MDWASVLIPMGWIAGFGVGWRLTDWLVDKIGRRDA